MEDRKMKLDVIHHIAIIVSDYQRSREFYVFTFFADPDGLPLELHE